MHYSVDVHLTSVVHQFATIYSYNLTKQQQLHNIQAYEFSLLSYFSKLNDLASLQDKMKRKLPHNK